MARIVIVVVIMVTVVVLTTVMLLPVRTTSCARTAASEIAKAATTATAGIQSSRNRLHRMNRLCCRTAEETLRWTTSQPSPLVLKAIAFATGPYCRGLFRQAKDCRLSATHRRCPQQSCSSRASARIVKRHGRSLRSLYF